MNNLKSTIHALQKKDQHIDYVLSWLQATFYMGESGSLLKATVYKEYCRMCEKQGWKPTSAAAFGKFVRKAFPNISSNRRGPRGSAKHHYRYLNYIDSQKNRMKQQVPNMNLIDAPTSSTSNTTVPSPISSPSSPVTRSTSSSEGEEEETLVMSVSSVVPQQRPVSYPINYSPYDPSSYYARPAYNGKSQPTTVPVKVAPIPVASPSFPPKNACAFTTTTTTTTKTTTQDNAQADAFVASLLMDPEGRRQSLLNSFPTSSAETCNPEEDEMLTSKRKSFSSNSSGALGTSSCPDLSAAWPQMTAMKRAYQTYYLCVLEAIMFRDETQVKTEINNFWTRTFSRLFVALPQTKEVRENLLAWEKEGMTFLMERLSQDASRMHSMEFADSLKTVSCYLPIWVQTSASSVLPKEMLIRQMNLWNQFSQNMYKRAQLMIQGLQFPASPSTPSSMVDAFLFSMAASPKLNPVPSACNDDPATCSLAEVAGEAASSRIDSGFESDVLSPAEMMFLNA